MWSLGLILLIIIITIIYLLSNLHWWSSESPLQERIYHDVETHAIVILNDEIHTTNNVVDTLVKVTGISGQQAINLMARIHQDGIAIVWAGDSKTARKHLVKIENAGLRCFVIEIPSNQD
jgi:ATP-dependent Clp protease adapter protein ClpS